MPTEDLLDFELLLAPIEGEVAVGPNLREDHSPNSIYHSLKDAATAARRAERQAQVDDDGSAPRPDWSGIINTAPDLIAKQSKDLEVASWLIEALVRSSGFAGLRDGFRLYRELVEKYWDQGIYPLIDEDGIESRIASMTGLNGEDRDGVLIPAIGRVPLTEQGGYGLSIYNQAVSLKEVTTEEERQQRISHGAVPMEDIERAARAGSAPFYTLLLEDVDGCVGEYAKLCAVLLEKCGTDAPPSSKIQNTLDDAQRLARQLAEPVLGSATPGDEEAGSQEEADGSAPAAASGKMRSREQAFATLLEVARFFRNTEPHSPLPYQLEQAVRWGKMSLRELLVELISDESTRSQLFQRVGIPDESSTSEY